MSYRDKYLFEESHGVLPSRMTSRRPIRSVKYSPYLEGENQNSGLIKKVTSKIGLMFNDIRTAVGSIFKGNEEGSFLIEEPSKEQTFLEKAKEFPTFQNHPINQVDFKDLTHVLSFENPIRREETLAMHNLNENQMEISFGGQNQNSLNGSGDTTFSFQPRKGGQNMLGQLNLSGKLSSGSSGRFKRKEKMNLMRILNFCHLRFEESNKLYAETLQKAYNRSLKSLLTKGLIKPSPIRTSLPTIEFRYNKVIGKYEAIRLLKKRKKAPADYQGDLKEQVLQMDMQNEDVVKPKYVYKRKKSTLPSQLAEEKIFIDFKNITNKYHHGSSRTPSKKINYAVHHLETDETDETEEHDLRKESPFKNAVFEEDKEDYIKLHGFQSSLKKKLKDQGVQTSEVKLSPIKDDKQPKSTPPLRLRRLLSINTNQKEIAQEEKGHGNVLEIPSSPLKEISFGDGYNNESFGNPKQDSSDKTEEAGLNILPENKSLQETYDKVNLIETNGPSTQEKDQILFDLPKTPTFTQGKLFQFNNKEVSSPIEKNRTNESQPIFETNPIKEDVEKKEDKGNISFENVADETTTKSAINIPQEEIKPKASLPILDFLKPYQSNASSTPSIENNPFLTPTVSQDQNLGLDKIIRQQSSKEETNNPFLNPVKPKEETDNPFLNPTKSDATSLLFARHNSSSNSTNENSNSLKPTSSVTSVNIFNNSPKQTSNGLWNHSPSNSNQNPITDSGNKFTNNASSLFGGDTSNKVNNSPANNIFQNPGNEMEREASMGMHNTLFNQQTSNNGLFQSNAQNPNLFSNFNNFNSSQNNQLGGLGGGGMGNLFSNTNNSMFGNSNNVNNTQGSNFGMFGNNFNQNEGASNNLFGGNLLGNNQSQNTLFNNNNQNNTNTSNNPFQGGLFNNNNNGMSMGSYQPNSAAVTQDAANFLGLGSGNNNNNNQQTSQGRVYRKIIQPMTSKNKDRAF